MKRERNCRNTNIKLYEELDEEDTRYWGLFYCGKDKQPRIDIKRFLKTTKTALSEKQLRIIKNRKSHYFYPKKKSHWDYNCNIFNRAMDEIEEDWLGESTKTLRGNVSDHLNAEELNKAVSDIESGKSGYRGFIVQAVEGIKKPPVHTVGDDFNFQCGIIDYEEAEMSVRMQNQINHYSYMEKCARLINSLYAQFFHQMMSKIETVQIEVFRKNNVNVKHFNRDVLKSVGAAKKVDIEKLEHYKYWDLGYCVWNFLKHNSVSTYQKLKEKFPEVLLSDEFEGGDLAYIFIKFSKENLIEKVFNGCREFFIEYCSVIWDEDEDEAQRNHEQYFERIVQGIIHDIREERYNPLGLPPWI
ncbi:MAG: hypothetical protein J1G05_02195 [Clostridiales bacterium]|nr:hypothetical protein [Clostridiales bacterium]